MELTTQQYIDFMNRINELEKKVNKSNFSVGLDPATVAKGIADEPEFPDSMTETMWQVIKRMAADNDKNGIEEIFRDAVRLTKQGIKGRLGV